MTSYAIMLAKLTLQNVSQKEGGAFFTAGSLSGGGHITLGLVLFVILLAFLSDFPFNFF